MIKGYPIRITKGTINTYSGELYLGEDSLYFFPTEKENALKTGLKRGLHKAAYDLHTSAKHTKTLEDGSVPETMTQEDLDTYVEVLPNAMKFEAAKIERIQQNWIRRLIRYDGKNYPFPDALSKELRAALKQWAKKNNVTTKGF